MLWGVLQDTPLSQHPGCKTGMQHLSCLFSPSALAPSPPPCCAKHNKVPLWSGASRRGWNNSTNNNESPDARH